MAFNSGRSSAYRDEVEAAFRRSAHGSVLRAKLEAANQNEKLALEMRAIALRTEQPGLLNYLVESEMNGKGGDIHFHGQTNIGGVSSSGTGAAGSITVYSVAEALSKAVPIAEEMLQTLERTDTPSSAKEGAELARAVVEQPTKGRFEKFVSWLKVAKEGGESFAGLAELAGKAYEKAQPLVEWLPDALG